MISCNAMSCGTMLYREFAERSTWKVHWQLSMFLYVGVLKIWRSMVFTAEGKSIMASLQRANTVRLLSTSLRRLRRYARLVLAPAGPQGAQYTLTKEYILK